MESFAEGFVLDHHDISEYVGTVKQKTLEPVRKMKSESKTHTSLTLYLRKETVSRLRAAAEADDRPISRYVDKVLTDALPKPAAASEGDQAA